MEFAISTHLFVRHRLTSLWLEKTRDAGFSAVEIFCARQHLDYRDKSQLEELGHWFRDSELKAHSMHSPMYSDTVWGRSGPQAVIDITEPVKAKRIAMVDEIKRALEFAEFVPFRYLVQHLGVTGQEMDERRMDSAFSSLDELKVFASQRGVQILLENTPNALSDAEQLNIFLARTHLNLNYCFDIGHAHMTGSIEDQFELMKDRIRSTHIHDNDGKQDSHLYPEEGSIDWKKNIKLLGTRQQQYPLLLELREPEGIEEPIEKARRTIDKLLEYLNYDER
jgi:sugar phosphate isomerase/epimerase